MSLRVPKFSSVVCLSDQPILQVMPGGIAEINWFILKDMQRPITRSFQLPCISAMAFPRVQFFYLRYF